jgi:aspartate-semialdehyde dehydrogenase
VSDDLASRRAKPRVVVVGGHRAFAPILAELLEDTAVVTRLTTLDHVVGDLEALSLEAVADADVVVLAMPGEPARAAAANARAEGAVIIDLLGELDGRRAVWPHQLPERLERGAVYTLVPGLAGTLGALIAVLAPFRPRLAVITTFESAAIADGPGMDALTDQVRSLLAFRDAEPGVLGERLAFNVVPSVTDDDEQAEARMTAHIRAAAGAGAPLVRLSRHLVPTYSGEGASVELAVEGTPLMDAVVATLAELPSVRVGRADAPTPHDAADRDEVLVGRLRVGAGRIALWVAADRLRSTTAVPIARLIQRFGA